MLALAPQRTSQIRAIELKTSMAEANSDYHDHFMPSDRRELIQTGERLAALKEDFADLKRTIESSHRDAASVLRQVEQGLKQEVKDLDARTRALENFRWWIVGAAAASGATAGFVSRFFHS